MAIISNGTTIASGGNVQAPTLTGNLPALNGSSLTNVPAGLELFEVKKFNSSTTYTPTSGTKFFRVYATGGGGGGGGLAPGASDRKFMGSGGNGGNTGVKHYTDTEMGANAAITIGAGGSGGSGENGGSTGGSTTFNPAGTGALTATGGYGGYFGGGGATTVTAPYPYANSTGGNADYIHFGDIATFGINGEAAYSKEGNNNYYVSGHGGNSMDSRKSASLSSGNSMFAKGGSSRVATSQGLNSGYNGDAGGGGGGGALAYNYASNTSGGSGGAGIVVIEEYK